MSHKSKNKKYPNSQTHEGNAEHNLNDGDVRVHGAIEVHPSPNLIKQHDTDREEDRTQKTKNYTVSLLTLIGVGVYSGLTLILAIIGGCQLKVSRDTLDLQSRPWVGISGNDSFRLQLVRGEPLKVVLIPKNFGTAPALKESSVNKMEEVPPLPLGRVPNFNAYTREEAGPPTVLFPGSVSTIQIDTTKPSTQGNIVFAHLTDEEIR